MAVEAIPHEIRAEVETNALFSALRRGDFAAAAHAQERLRQMGWHLTRETPQPQRRHQNAHQKAPRPKEVGA
jgi:hypothetical protein